MSRRALAKSATLLALALLVLPAAGSAAWQKLWGPAGVVVFRADPTGTSELFATQGTGTDPTGDIWCYMGSSMPWKKLGGPGSQFVVGPATATEPFLVGLSPDKKSVWLMEYVVSGGKVEPKWSQIGGPASQIYGGGAGIFATNPTTGDLYQYSVTAKTWTKIGGPGKMFAVGKDTVYGLSPDGSGVWEYSGTPMKWSQIGGPAKTIYAGGYELFATNPTSGDIYEYSSTTKKWTQVGGPGKMFAVTGAGTLYGLSPKGTEVRKYTGTPMKWAKIGGAADKIFAGGLATGISLCATNPTTHDLWCYEGS